MSKFSVISGIDKDKLCVGCGLCEAICGKASVEMTLTSDGFYHPIVKNSDKNCQNIISKICPGINIKNEQVFDKTQRIWGKTIQCYTGYSTQSLIREQASSGGIISGLAVYLLENKLVNAVLQVAGNKDDYKKNSLKVSYTKDDVLQSTSSRYAPALVFTNILEILRSNNYLYCFIGKPCDISALKNLISEFPEFANRFKFTISIFCAGIPSFLGTKKIIENFEAVEKVSELVYRGNGWPGYFSFIDQNRKLYKMSYNDSWGKYLNKYLNFRCKICPDGIGIQADIAVGDAWRTKDGYPDFSEAEGISLIIVRTDLAQRLLLDAYNEKQIMLETINEDELQYIQPYQYYRRKIVGARIIATQLVLFRRLNFMNLRTFSNLKFLKWNVFYIEFIGSFKRLIKARFFYNE